MYWSGLPKELRLEILEALGRQGNIARYASVCQEWQATLSKYTFHTLSLRARDLPVFRMIKKRHLELVRYIWFSIRLRGPCCIQCNIPEERDRVYPFNQKIIQHGLQDLLHALSGCPSAGDLTLEISLHPPSDSRRRLPCEAYEVADRSSFRTAPKPVPRHHPIHSSRPAIPSLWSTSRKYGVHDIKLKAKVNCVTQLILRRQTRRRWEPYDIAQLLDCFPELQSFCFEPWREWASADQSITDNRMVGLLGLDIVNRLKKLIVFEDFNRTYAYSHGPDYVVTYGEHTGIRSTRPPSARVTGRLAAASLDLQHLSAAFMADARLFWDAVQADWVWASLLTLSLTAQDLFPREDRRDVNEVLRRGAEVVKKMPQLQIVELWNSKHGNAAVFRYMSSKPGVAPRIEWRSNWRFKLQNSVVAAWQSISTDLRDLEVQYEFINSALVQNHGDAVAAFELQLEVVCPVSIEEIRREHEEVIDP